MKLEKLQEREDLILTSVSDDIFGEIRIAIIKESKILYAAKDVADALQYKKTRNAIEQHVDESHKVLLRNKNFKGLKKGRMKLANFGAIFIDEAGLYDLILSSKMPDAKAFKRWLTEDVIPTLREEGVYDLSKAKKKYKKSAYTILDRVKDMNFQRQTKHEVSEISRLTGMLKGNVWKEFNRIYDLMYHTCLTIKRKHLIEKLGCKDINRREYLDICGEEEKERAMVVFMLMRVGGGAVTSLTEKQFECLKVIVEYLSNSFSEIELLRIEAKAKKFYKKNIENKAKQKAKKKKKMGDVLQIEIGWINK